MFSVKVQEYEENYTHIYLVNTNRGMRVSACLHSAKIPTNTHEYIDLIITSAGN